MLHFLLTGKVIGIMLLKAKGHHPSSLFRHVFVNVHVIPSLQFLCKCLFFSRLTFFHIDNEFVRFTDDSLQRVQINLSDTWDDFTDRPSLSTQRYKKTVRRRGGDDNEQQEKKKDSASSFSLKSFLDLSLARIEEWKEQVFLSYALFSLLLHYHQSAKQ